MLILVDAMRDENYLLSFERIRSSLAYDALTGVLTWKARKVTTRGDAIFNAKFVGKRAGVLRSDGYRYVCFSFGKSKNVVISEHRIVLAFQLGRLAESHEYADHENGERSSNRDGNIRLADATGNSSNAKLPATNKSGFKGVHHVPNKRGAKHWLANISIGNKTKFIGYFHTAEQAARAYDASAIQNYGDFAKTNSALGLL